MSKKTSKGLVGASSDAAAANSNNQNDSNNAVFFNRSGQLCVNIRAKPGSKENAIVDVLDDAISVKIAAPPIDGEANKELIAYVAELLNIKSRDGILDKGSINRNKVLILSNCALSIEQLLMEFRKNSESKNQLRIDSFFSAKPSNKK